MRAIWKGAVSFGLVAIAVKLYSATEEKDVRFHQVHRPDGGRIRYRKKCEVCGQDVETAEIAKGYDIGGGEMVLLDEEDFADLPLSTSRAVDVLEFVPAEQIDPILYNKAYYLEPEPIAVKPYVLLRDALRTGDQVAIVKVAFRQREQLATLRVRDDVLVLNTMLWPDEIRSPDFAFLEDEVNIRPQELQMATSLIESMAADFNPDEFTDDYRKALQEVIQAKIEGHEIVSPPQAEEPSGQVIDLMAALKASVAKARGDREQDAEPEAEPVKPARKAAAKRALKSVPEPTSAAEPTKKPAAKRAPARARKPA